MESYIMKTTREVVALRQQIIARALANSLANEFGLLNNRSIDHRLPVGHYIIYQNAMTALNPANLMASLLGIHLN